MHKMKVKKIYQEAQEEVNSIQQNIHLMKFELTGVSVRLNEEELSILDSKRGPYKKGEWLRMASLNKLPPVLPEINREAWIKLGNLSQDLNRLLNHLDSKSPDSELTRTELFALRRQIKTLRDHLIPSTFLEQDQ
ncbi:Uncharacterised protein [Klebsiella grimontii]|nr:Uncharacterised protein [Klebsiella grimontii]